MIYGKEEFLNIYNTFIKRDGAEKLLEFLLSSDFFTAPASTRFHSAFEGGLCSHSVNVYKRLLFNIQNEFGEEYEKFYSNETINKKVVCLYL